ncbi:MAG TPA: cupin domain-containing protein [Candidatus Saccharimonadales bacterium]|nr:cupin domain-containing protein [Candidatus Saccharimonadales bacterium]
MPETRPAALPAAAALQLADLVGYAEGSIVSRAIVQEPAASLTLFAFDAGQALSEHTTAFDAYLQVLDGEADLAVGGKAFVARAGDVARLPEGVPHEVTARVRFKMLLTMVRPTPRAGPDSNR